MGQPITPVAIIIPMIPPTMVVRILPRNIRQAARRRGSPRSKRANSTDFTVTATASTRNDLERASAGAMTCMNGRTGSHAVACIAAIIRKGSNRNRLRLDILCWPFFPSECLGIIAPLSQCRDDRSRSSTPLYSSTNAFSRASA